VDGAGDHFLAGAGFAGDHHRQVVGRDARHQRADRVERAARRAYQPGQTEGAAYLFLLVFDPAAQRRLGGAQVERQALVFLLQAPQLGRALQGQQQLFGLPGLQQVLPDAGFVDAADDVLGVGVAGEDDADDVRPALADFLEKLDAGGAGHALVAEDDADAGAGFFHLQDFPAFAGAGRAEHLEILFQRAAQRFLRTQLVVDDEDGRQAAQHGGIHVGIIQSRSRCRARCRGVHECGLLWTK